MYIILLLHIVNLRCLLDCISVFEKNSLIISPRPIFYLFENRILITINGERLNFGYSNQNWHETGSCIGPSRVHNSNNLIYFYL
jgi:hypothetical protein